jgi:hypothetical protein
VPNDDDDGDDEDDDDDRASKVGSLFYKNCLDLEGAGIV